MKLLSLTHTCYGVLTVHDSSGCCCGRSGRLSKVWSAMGKEFSLKHVRLPGRQLLGTGNVNGKPCANAELQSTELNVENMIISPTRHDTQRLNGLTFPALVYPFYVSMKKFSFLFMLMKGSSTMMHGLIRRITFPRSCFGFEEQIALHVSVNIRLFSFPESVQTFAFVSRSELLHVTHKLNPISIPHPRESIFVL